MSPCSSSNSGLEPVGPINWGNHICHFYKNGDDLAETLIPYFKCGLEQNEACLWVASEPYPVARAMGELRAAISDLDCRIESGQFTIYSHDQWYAQQEGINKTEVLQGWLRRSDDAVKQGFDGLRLSGNTAWLTADVWDDFMDYERAV